MDGMIGGWLDGRMDERKEVKMMDRGMWAGGWMRVQVSGGMIN